MARTDVDWVELLRKDQETIPNNLIQLTIRSF